MLLAAAANGHVHELQSLLNLSLLLDIINKLISHRVAITADNTDRIEAERVLIVRESETSLSKILTSHQVLFCVHFEDAPTQPFIIDGGPVYCFRIDGLCFGQVLESMLVLLYSHIPVGTVDVDVEYQVVVHLLVEFARRYLICLAV